MGFCFYEKTNFYCIMFVFHGNIEDNGHKIVRKLGVLRKTINFVT